jgi:hypothetical protein
MAAVAPHGPGAQRRLARQLREAALLATPAELLDLERIERLVRLGVLTAPAASAIVRHVLRTQHADPRVRGAGAEAA